MNIVIRKGKKEDIPQVFDLILELADFEKARHEVNNTVERMQREGPGGSQNYDLFVAEDAGRIVGISLYFFSYSTWKGKSLYIDDLIVTEAYRGRGIGKRLFDATARVARKSDCGKMHWQVLDWNKAAIEYYASEGASFDGEWINCALSRNQLHHY